MKVVSTVGELQTQIRNTGLSPLGFIPTMGALHEGHISLVRNAMDRCPVVVVSIYVNPAQFNDKEDLKNYPRTPESDKEFLNKVLRENDLIFTPEDNEVYPEEDKREFRFGNLDNVMEALQRPGHFNGVARVVSRLFEIVNPDYAYFGQKDFQQLAVIKKLVKQTGSKVRIIGNPIIREPDGLAMSSRNSLLEPEIRKSAAIIYKTLSSAAVMLRDHDISEVKSFVMESIESISDFKVGYFDIVDDTELIPVEDSSYFREGKRYFACIAVMAGKIRLIDNIEIPLIQSKG